MTRCALCSKQVYLAASREDETPLRKWATYEELSASADSGCDLCNLFRQRLTTYVSKKALLEKHGEVRLYGDGDELGLECAAFDGSLTILPQKSRANLPSAPSRQGFDVIKQADAWLRRCLRDHRVCGREPTAYGSDPLSRLPSRLLDLSQDSTILVINVAEWIELGLSTVSELSEYCTLSYRWGSGSHKCVLAGPFSTLLEIPLESTPQTFKDAVAVVRALGIRFLWIDALCIVQPSASGDDSDWRAEGPRMGAIYENAIFIIAATCSASTEEGFLAQVGSNAFAAEPCKIAADKIGVTPVDNTEGSQPDDTRILTQTVYLPVAKPSIFRAVAESGLNARGWVMQERALSRRIIHFTEQGMFWECCECHSHDLFGDYDAQKHDGPCRTKQTLLSVARASHSQHLCPVEWFHFIKAYSFAEFTDNNDRLIALSSVAKAVEPILGKGQGYYAGIWRNDLVRGLMWHCHSPSKKPRGNDKQVAPSWSWASVEGSVDFAALGLDTFGMPLVEVLGVTVSPVLASNPFGNLREGRVKLSGRLHRVALQTVNAFEWRPRLVVHWDEAQDTEEVRMYTVLPLGGCTDNSFGQILFGALILTPINPSAGDVSTPGTPELYRRVGMVQYTHSSFSWTATPLREMKTNWVRGFETEVTIV